MANIDENAEVAPSSYFKSVTNHCVACVKLPAACPSGNSSSPGCIPWPRKADISNSCNTSIDTSGNAAEKYGKKSHHSY